MARFRKCKKVLSLLLALAMTVTGIGDLGFVHSSKTVYAEEATASTTYKGEYYLELEDQTETGDDIITINVDGVDTKFKKDAAASYTSASVTVDSSAEIIDKSEDYPDYELMSATSQYPSTVSDINDDGSTVVYQIYRLDPQYTVNYYTEVSTDTEGAIFVNDKYYILRSEETVKNRIDNLTFIAISQKTDENNNIINEDEAGVFEGDVYYPRDNTYKYFDGYTYNANTTIANGKINAIVRRGNENLIELFFDKKTTQYTEMYLVEIEDQTSDVYDELIEDVKYEVKESNVVTNQSLDASATITDKSGEEPYSGYKLISSPYGYPRTVFNIADDGTTVVYQVYGLHPKYTVKYYLEVSEDTEGAILVNGRYYLENEDARFTSRAPEWTVVTMESDDDLTAGVFEKYDGDSTEYPIDESYKSFETYKFNRDTTGRNGKSNVCIQENGENLIELFFDRKTTNYTEKYLVELENQSSYDYDELIDGVKYEVKESNVVTNQYVASDVAITDKSKEEPYVNYELQPSTTNYPSYVSDIDDDGNTIVYQIYRLRPQYTVKRYVQVLEKTEQAVQVGDKYYMAESETLTDRVPTGTEITYVAGTDDITAGIAIAGETVEMSVKSYENCVFSDAATEEYGKYSVTASNQNDNTIALFYDLDLTAPTGTLMIQGENLSWNSNEDKTGYKFFWTIGKLVSIVAADNAEQANTGLDKIQYILSETSLTESALGNITNWLTYTNAFELAQNSVQYIYAKLTDKAGNSSYISSDGIVIYTDSEADTENIDYEKLSGDQADVRVVLNGNTIQKLYIVVDGSEVEVPSWYYEISENVITLDGAYLDRLEAKTHTFMVSYNPQGYECAEGIAKTSFTVTIGKATPTVEILDYTLPTAITYYNGKAQGIGAVTSDEVEVTVYYMVNGQWQTEAPVNAGTYDVAVDTAENEDYLAASKLVLGDYTITPAPMKVTVDRKSKVYGEADEELTYTVEGLLEGDSLTGSLVREAGEDVGTYAINMGSLDAGANYSMSFRSSEYTITQKDITGATVTLDGTALTYNGKEQTKNVTEVLIDGLEVTYEVSGNTGIDAGSYQLTVTGTGNFTGSILQDWSIAKAKYVPDVEGNKVPDSEAEAGYSTKLVKDITLPEDWTWQNPDAELEVGENVIKAVYIGEDASNYENIEMSVVITRAACTHNYTGVVTKQPTTKEEGVKTFTCDICGDSYTETIAKLEEEETTEGETPAEEEKTTEGETPAKEETTEAESTVTQQEASTTETKENSTLETEKPQTGDAWHPWWYIMVGSIMIIVWCGKMYAVKRDEE